MRRFLVAIVAVILALPTGALAGLAPTKGSQLVNGFASGACPVLGFTGGNSQLVSQLLNGDGTTSPFVIPPKRIFVITQVTATLSFEPAGDVMATAVVVGTPSAGSPIAGRFEPATASGSLVSTFTFPTGAVVKSGASICVQVLNLDSGGFVGFTAYVHGYFAPDK